ncbi:MAG TPA: type I-U CRISPR-associated protein Cas8c [Tepidisphaeraceae bacterium]|nr:type I-U CRISPR-associated protein Cas8c [Tepidisphaeraceae bacterium]
MSDPTPSFSVNVDVTNPGQFFACCGLLELAHRLWPGAEGWFDLSGNRFVLGVTADNATLAKLVEHIAQCPIEGLTAAQRQELAELELRKRELRRADRTLPEVDEQRRLEFGRLAREGHLVLEDFHLTLDWWQEDGTPATWAGKQEIHKIARAAQDGIAKCVAEGRSLKDMLNWQLVLRTSKEYQSQRAADKKVEPFYFDARRYAHPLDAGFSLDVQGAETAANPATELLCLIGLQRFRPQRAPDSKWTFQYCAWTHPLGVTQAAAVAAGVVPLPQRRRFSFTMQFRDDQKRYKAFGFAVPIGGDA